MRQMDHGDIQKRIDAIEVSMRGRTQVKCVELQIRSHDGPSVYLRHDPLFSDDHHNEKYKFFRLGGDIDTVKDLLTAAEQFVSEMPTKDDAERTAFLEKLSGVIEFGNKIGIDVDYVNPLVEMMKRLSENALTHQPSTGAA